MEWQARQPRVSNSSLPCAAFPGCAWAGIGQRGLPQVRGNCFDLILIQAEIRHLGRGTEVARLSEPHGNPSLVQLEANVLKIRGDFFHVLEEALGGTVKLHDAQVQFAVVTFNATARSFR